MVEPLTAIFPGLGQSAFRVTSAVARAYNCIAWAAGDVTRWWWPDFDAENDATYWPAGAAVEETLDAFTAMFATLGFIPGSSEELEPAIEKVALFASHTVPTHAARQLSNGRWTSKLGLREDIEHDLHAIAGDAYGQVAVIMKRPQQST